MALHIVAKCWICTLCSTASALHKQYHRTTSCVLSAKQQLRVTCYAVLSQLTWCVQVRSTGPVNPVTRQPIKGRKFGGGIRFGEMERDALLAHGAAYLLHDRLHTCSDYTVMEVCSACGSLLSPNQYISSSSAADLPRTAGGMWIVKCELWSRFNARDDHHCWHIEDATDICFCPVLRLSLQELYYYDSRSA